MNGDIARTKTGLRAEVRERLAALTSAQRASASAQVCSRLRGQQEWKSAGIVMLFAPMQTEPEVWPLIVEALAAGKTVALPRFSVERGDYVTAQVRDLQADIVTGKFGIREPAASCPTVALNRLDFALVPGVAFDLNGWRLGRGRGDMDRLLASVCGVTCGVAFDEQIVPAIPVEPHDVRLNCILTPTRWCRIANPRAVLE